MDLFKFDCCRVIRPPLYGASRTAATDRQDHHISNRAPHSGPPFLSTAGELHYLEACNRRDDVLPLVRALNKSQAFVKWRTLAGHSIGIFLEVDNT